MSSKFVPKSAVCESNGQERSKQDRKGGEEKEEKKKLNILMFLYRRLLNEKKRSTGYNLASSQP